MIEQPDQPATCSSCRYFEPIDGVTIAGSCHRYPPNSHPRVMGVDADDEAPGEPTKFPQFPLVDADTWCGEHSAVPVVILEAGNVVADERRHPCTCGHAMVLHQDGAHECTAVTSRPEGFCPCATYDPAEVPAGS